MILTQTWGIAAKEFQLARRYPLATLSRNLISPIKMLILFSIIYWGVFSAGLESIGSFRSEHIIILLLTGTLINTIFSGGVHLFIEKFHNEKVWKTIQIIITAPINLLSVFAGYWITWGAINIVLPILIFGILLILFQMNLIYLIVIILLLISAFTISLAYGLIIGTACLHNENWKFPSELFVYVWTFLSCFYYPIELLPKFLHTIIQINPIYIITNSIRNIMTQSVLPGISDIILIIIFTVSIITISLLFFRYRLRNKPIIGY